MVPSQDILQCFFYDLVRDRLPTGVIEGIIVNLEQAKDRGILEYKLSSDTVAQLAKEWAERLRKLEL